MQYSNVTFQRVILHIPNLIMDLDAEYKQLREDLYQLGFHQPLPIGSLALVQALLLDLVKTTLNLKKLHGENQQLLKVNNPN